MSGTELALLGGTPVRTEPFVVEPMIDATEERMVLEAIRDKAFSRYIGSSAPDIEETLRLTSAAANKSSDYWHFLGGPNVRAFAAEFADAFEIDFAVPINSATSGIGVALAAAGVGPGDEVIVPAISFTATASAVLMFNSIPVFVDVDPMTFCLDPEQVEAAITPHTKAILVVHLTGNLADMDAIMDIARRHNLKVVEDAAQAIGARWGDRKAGCIGDAGVFSFQQSKNIMTGEGGMIVTADAELARRARLILNHGENVLEAHNSDDDLANIVGMNLRLPELCAAIGRAQLAKLDAVNLWRTRNAETLRNGLNGMPGLEPAPSQRAGNGPGEEVPHMFVALYDSAKTNLSRDLFVAALRAEGVPVGTGYVRTMYANPTFLKRVAYGSAGCPWTCGHYRGAARYEPGMCPVAEELLDERFLWFYHIAHPSTEKDMADIVRAVGKVIENRAVLAAKGPDIVGHGVVRGQGRLAGV